MTAAVAISPVPSISPAQISAAHKAAAETRRPTVEVLEQQLGLSPGEFTAALACALHYTPLSMSELNAMTPAFDVLPFKNALKHKCLAFRDNADGLVLVFSDPFNDGLVAWAQEEIAVPFIWHLAHQTDVDAYLARHEETLHAMDSVLPSNDAAAVAQSDVEDLSILAISENTSPVVKLVHSTLYDALKTGASDVHLETGANGLAIKYRIDGVLSLVGSMAGLELAEQVISRVKVMSELDIAERRIPQDGRFKISSRGRGTPNTYV